MNMNMKADTEKGIIDFANITCKLHNKNQIEIDSNNFHIVCKVCHSSANLIIGNNNSYANSEPNPDFNKTCFKHPNEESLFFCDDCSEFICKSCFATDHRNHNSSTFELMVKHIKEGLKKLVNDLNMLKKNVDDNLQNVQDLNSYFIANKTSFKSTLKDINDRIIKNLSYKAKEFSEEIENIFNGIDFEVENSTQRLENTKKKATKMLNEFQNLYKEVEAIKSQKQICLLKKEKDGVLSENIKFLSDLQFFLNENLERTKLKSIKEMENFSKRCSKFQKKSEIYENSVIKTIVSGIPNICMRVRRFKRFYYNNTKYFKTNSVCMLTSHTINLVGFSICGLFNNKTNINNNVPGELKLGIKIFEMDTVNDFNISSTPAICSIETKLPVIFNVIDPVYQFYLNNAVTINKDKVYFILMNNLGENNYVDLWSGEVSKERDDVTENQHSVVCNNSNVKFNFIEAVGVESDCNEFTGGILSDLIFSHIE